MRSMGPQEGITQQISNVRLYEAMLIFDHQDEMGNAAWRIQIQDDQELRAARMVDLCDDLQDPHDPL